MSRSDYERRHAAADAAEEARRSWPIAEAMERELLRLERAPDPALREVMLSVCGGSGIEILEVHRLADPRDRCDRFFVRFRLRGFPTETVATVSDVEMNFSVDFADLLIDRVYSAIESRCAELVAVA